MGKVLVIVESPAKAKTINQYLGHNYVVKSSFGHVRDLPISGSAREKHRITKATTSTGKPNSTLVKRMGIDPFYGWKAYYEIVPGKEKVVSELKKLAEKVDHIYLATDLDREGEAIAWHLRELIGGDNNRFSRVVFNEITSNAIKQAFENPVQLNMNRVNAQQTRRFMDRIVGYMVSPLLWQKIARGLSAGRVQSVAVRLIVEREREIKKFVQQEYWELHLDLETQQSMPLTMQVTHFNKKPLMLLTKKQTNTVLARLKTVSYVISTCKNKKTTRKPNAPFITATLQQAAYTRLGYSIKKTMLLAQLLYEAGYITYMRTDSPNLSEPALKMVRSYILEVFGPPYLPPEPNKYSRKKDKIIDQDAHEAIRPSDVYIIGKQLTNLEIEEDTKKLYKLIWEQFVACQMTSAQYEYTDLIATAGEFQLRTHGSMQRFDGWTKVMSASRKNIIILPEVKVGQTLTLKELRPSKHFTQPPARYSEASLVKELEKRGIGRPSTYVSILTTIQERGYVYVTNRRFYAEKIGELVTARLEENFSELMNYNFTAKMESILDKIAANQQEWKNVLDTFFENLSKQLKHAEKAPELGGMRPNKMIIINLNCTICGRSMGIRTASTGIFLGCSGYTSSLKDRCKNTINLIQYSTVSHGDSVETNARSRCNKCHSVMDSYFIDNKHKLHFCGNNPLCDGYEIEHGVFYLPNTAEKCDKCSSEMSIGRFGKYMVCTNDLCSNTSNILHHGNVSSTTKIEVPIPELLCKTSKAYFILRNGAAGVFLAANTFPKSRETRAPLVEELAMVKDRLPETFRYLADAPVHDDNGNKTIVRFNRKTKQQFICSNHNGKSTGWSALFVNGKWQVTTKASSRSEE